MPEKTEYDKSQIKHKHIFSVKFCTVKYSFNNKKKTKATSVFV